MSERPDNMSSGRWAWWFTILVLVSLLLSIAVLIVYADLQATEGWHRFWAFLGVKTARSELLDFYKLVRLGQPRQEVETIFAQHAYRWLRLKNSETGMIVSTPTALNAKNWFLFIEFCEDDKVSALCFRYNDSSNHKPQSAPYDQVVNGTPENPKLAVTNEY